MTHGGPLFAVVDVGTGSIRAHLIGADGAVEASAARPGHVRLATDGRAEVDADEIWGATVACLAEVVGTVDPGRVAAVGAASALGYLLVDACGRPVGPAMLWMDRRAVREARALGERIDEAALYAITGRRLDPEVLLAKLAWLRCHEPERLARAATFIGLKDDVVRRLTGAIGTDPTHAAYTMLYDVRTREWSAELVGLAGLRREFLPRLRDAGDIAGSITAEAAAATGLRAGTPVIAGTSDGTAACLLAGAEPGTAVNVTGTSDVVMAGAAGPIGDPARRTLVNPHPLGAGYMVGAVLGTTGGALRWLAERLDGGLAGDDRYRRLDDEAARVPPGARGVVCLPGLAGDRAPRWDAQARAAFVGLDLSHGRGELARAILDAVALDVRAVVTALARLGADVRRLRVVGGGARSDLWCQIRADATGLVVERPRSVEGTATAVALLAGIAVGVYPDLADGAGKAAPVAGRFEPEAERVETYAALAEVAERIHAGLAPVWPLLSRWRT